MKTKKHHHLRALLCAVVLLLLLIAGGLLCRTVRADMRRQAAAALKQTVVQAAVQCYAVEGCYPPSLEYLEKNYGVSINHRRFIVSYSAFASNQMPDIMVLEKS